MHQLDLGMTEVRPPRRAGREAPFAPPASHASRAVRTPDARAGDERNASGSGRQGPEGTGRIGPSPNPTATGAAHATDRAQALDPTLDAAAAPSDGGPGGDVENPTPNGLVDRRLTSREDSADEDAEPGPRATIRGQVRVEGFLRSLLGPRVLVWLTENRSTMISFSRKRGVVYVRLHAIFADAPEHVLGAVARFVTERSPGPKASWLIDQWIEAHRHLVKRPDVRAPPLPRGEVHDLQKLYDELNRVYFGGRVDARITWSIAARKRKRASIRLGSYSEEERLIRIHPALDQAFVPEFFVASVVFHEMLHQLHGAHERADGTRRVHTRGFRRDEAKFRDHQRARAWEAENLHRLLRY